MRISVCLIIYEIRLPRSHKLGHHLKILQKREKVFQRLILILGLPNILIEFVCEIHLINLFEFRQEPNRVLISILTYGKADVNKLLVEQSLDFAFIQKA